jgi:hypothetical protein
LLGGVVTRELYGKRLVWAVNMLFDCVVSRVAALVSYTAHFCSSAISSGVGKASTRVVGGSSVVGLK